MSNSLNPSENFVQYDLSDHALKTAYYSTPKLQKTGAKCAKLAKSNRRLVRYISKKIKKLISVQRTGS
jgi:hypothetical protein